MWETENMKIRFIPKGSWLDFKFNSELVTLVINTSPWVNNLVLFFFSGVYCPLSLPVVLQLKEWSYGWSLLKAEMVVDSSTKGNNHWALKLNYYI